ncbi:MAG: hypothetical protein OXG72_00125 [Acidobacteria bacterium]|nr:hypothetical protein [Acidobacteriota bacterium]
MPASDSNRQSRIGSDIGQCSIVPLWLVESGVPHGAIALFALMDARYADREGGSIFPSRNTLAEKLDCSPASVTAWRKALQKVGALTVVRRGQGRTNNYQLHHAPLTDNDCLSREQPNDLHTIDPVTKASTSSTDVTEVDGGKPPESPPEGPEELIAAAQGVWGFSIRKDPKKGKEDRAAARRMHEHGITADEVRRAAETMIGEEQFYKQRGMSLTRMLAEWERLTAPWEKAGQAPVIPPGLTQKDLERMPPRVRQLVLKYPTQAAMKAYRDTLDGTYGTAQIGLANEALNWLPD